MFINVLFDSNKYIIITQIIFICVTQTKLISLNMKLADIYQH